MRMKTDVNSKKLFKSGEIRLRRLDFQIRLLQLKLKKNQNTLLHLYNMENLKLLQLTQRRRKKKFSDYRKSST